MARKLGKRVSTAKSPQVLDRFAAAEPVLLHCCTAALLHCCAAAAGGRRKRVERSRTLKVESLRELADPLLIPLPAGRAASRLTQGSGVHITPCPWPL